MQQEEFDLEKALAGEPVITRCGKKVTEIFHAKTVDQNKCPLIVVICGGLFYYPLNGKNPFDSKEDLFMEKDKEPLYFVMDENGKGMVYFYNIEDRDKFLSRYIENYTDSGLNNEEVKVVIGQGTYDTYKTKRGK